MPRWERFKPFQEQQSFEVSVDHGVSTLFDRQLSSPSHGGSLHP
jgi:hypothetical protein